MGRTLSKDTQLCISLAARPGNIGTRFHNFLYDQLGLDFVYKACTTDDLPAAIAGVRALGIRGCGVSMPFKEACLPLLDAVVPAAAAIGAVNTIVNDGGRLTGANTDFVAVRDLLAEFEPAGREVAVVGSGGMAKAVVAAIVALGWRRGTVVARNERRGTALAARHGWRWTAQLGPARPAVIANATPVGMAGSDDEHALPVPADVVAAASLVLDVVAVPPTTALIAAARAAGARVVTGAEVSATQAAAQFALYTGVRPDDALVRLATAHAQAG